MWIRTTIDGVKVRSLTIRRRAAREGGGIERVPEAVNAAPSGVQTCPTTVNCESATKSAARIGRWRTETGVEWRRVPPMRRLCGRLTSRRVGHRTRASALARAASPQVWRDRSRHQQLPLADCAPDRGRVYGHRCFSRFVRLGEGLSRSGQSRRMRWTARWARSASAPRSFAGATSRSPVPSPRKPAGGPRTGIVRRTRPIGNRHRARHHPAVRGGKAGGIGLPQIARAGRRRDRPRGDPAGDVRHPGPSYIEYPAHVLLHELDVADPLPPSRYRLAYEVQVHPRSPRPRG